jgi:hypothetical protein
VTSVSKWQQRSWQSFVTNTELSLSANFITQ